MDDGDWIEFVLWGMGYFMLDTSILLLMYEYLTLMQKELYI